MLSERSQGRKVTCQMITFTRNVQNRGSLSARKLLHVWQRLGHGGGEAANEEGLCVMVQVSFGDDENVQGLDSNGGRVTLNAARYFSKR